MFWFLWLKSILYTSGGLNVLSSLFKNKFFFLSYCTGSVPQQCWVGMLRVDLLTLTRTLRLKHSVSHHGVRCSLQGFIDAFHQGSFMKLLLLLCCALRTESLKFIETCCVVYCVVEFYKYFADLKKKLNSLLLWFGTWPVYSINLINQWFSNFLSGGSDLVSGSWSPLIRIFK